MVWQTIPNCVDDHLGNDVLAAQRFFWLVRLDSSSVGGAQLFLNASSRCENTSLVALVIEHGDTVLTAVTAAYGAVQIAGHIDPGVVSGPGVIYAKLSGCSKRGGSCAKVRTCWRIDAGPSLWRDPPTGSRSTITSTLLTVDAMLQARSSYRVVARNFLRLARL